MYSLPEEDSNNLVSIILSSITDFYLGRNQVRTPVYFMGQQIPVPIPVPAVQASSFTSNQPIYIRGNIRYINVPVIEH